MKLLFISSKAFLAHGSLMPREAARWQRVCGLKLGGAAGAFAAQLIVQSMVLHVSAVSVPSAAMAKSWYSVLPRALSAPWK
eukprot:9178803-Prorocentrum_lima.AAC.1